MATKRRSKARAGRVAGQWGVVYRKSRRKVPRTRIYGLGSNAQRNAKAAAKAHNAGR